MSENEKVNGPADDVEGHVLRSGRIADEPQDDSEGHAIRSGRLVRSGRVADEPVEDDVEGHAIKWRVTDEPQAGDDVEGHMPFKRF